MIDELFELNKLEPGDVTISVTAETPKDMALAKMVNEKANKVLEKMLKYAEWRKNHENDTR